MARRYTLRPEPAAGAPELRIDYAAALDPQQFAAATAPPGATLVVAGAGTGKTRTLVYRLAHLVESGVPADRIVLLTFTRRAARQMLDRAAQTLAEAGASAGRARGGTFHSACAEVLRRHGDAAGLGRRFTILDASDAADVLDLLRSERRLDRAETRFPTKRAIQRLFSTAANRAEPLAATVERDAPQFTGHLDALVELHVAFQAYKLRYGLADYDDLLGLTARLLRENDAVRRSVAGRMQHVLVDEYQDVNAAQAELVELFASVHGGVTAVGDDAQSIYGFRGADVQHILDFPRRHARDGVPARVVKLEHNYRSTQPILDLANWTLERAAVGYDKRLFTDRAGGETPALVQAPDETWEARFVAQVVLDRREAGVALSRQAVLFRSGWASYALEAELGRRKIPYVKYGGLKLAEAAHIKDVVAHLRVAENPADAVAWNRALRLCEGVGPQTARAVLDAITAAADGTPTADWTAAVRSAKARAEIERLVATVAALRDPERTLGQQLDRLLDAYRPAFERAYPDDFPAREPDLEAFAALAARFATRAELLEALALDPLDLTADGVEPETPDEAPLVLSTIHSAKGLEFDTVFLIEALDGVLPSRYALATPAETEEERRLLYVALTRAETELYVGYPLTQTQRGAGSYLTNVTRFLKDAPEAILEPWTLDEGPPEPPALPAPPRALGP